MVKSAAKPDENFRDRKFVWDGADHPTSTGISERRPASDADADETQSVESYRAEIDSDGGGSSSDQVAKKSDGTSGAELWTRTPRRRLRCSPRWTVTFIFDGSTSIVPSSPIEEEINGADDAAKEMMTQLKRGRGVVNPRRKVAPMGRHLAARVGRRGWRGTARVPAAAVRGGRYHDDHARRDGQGLRPGRRARISARWRSSTTSATGFGGACSATGAWAAVRDNWHGVVCTGGQVTQLNMNLNNVACWGELNLTALAKLDELLYLDMSDNLFSGEIPDELFSMTKLQTLALSSNRMTGKLSKKFGRLKNLRHLDLSANGFHGALPKRWARWERSRCSTWAKKGWR